MFIEYVNHCFFSSLSDLASKTARVDALTHVVGPAVLIVLTWRRRQRRWMAPPIGLGVEDSAGPWRPRHGTRPTTPLNSVGFAVSWTWWI